MPALSPAQPLRRRPPASGQDTIVRRRARARGLLVTELAPVAGSTREHLSSVMNGRYRGSVELWRRLAAVLDCDPDELHDDGWAR